MKNVSGDTVIGKYNDCTIICRWLLKANHLRLALFLQMVRIVSWRFPLTAEALMSMWGTVAVPNSTVRMVNTQYKKNIHLLNHSFPSWVLLCHSFFLCSSLILLSFRTVGAVCVRVPSSLKAGVELCGASVDVSPEVVLHGVKNNTSEGQTTVTGKSLFFITSHSMPQLINETLLTSKSTHNVLLPFVSLSFPLLSVCPRLLKWRVSSGAEGQSSGRQRLRQTEDTKLVWVPEAGELSYEWRCITALGLHTRTQSQIFTAMDVLLPHGSI